MLAAVFLLNTACSEDAVMEDSTPNKHIEFHQEIQSKALISGANDVKDFKVWCEFTPQTSPNQSFNLFDGDRVYRSSSVGGFIYDELRYWFNGHYQYAAIHPYSLGGVQNGKSIVSFTPSSAGELLKITSYQLTRDEDLMIAVPKQMECTTENVPSSVNFTFSHVLSQVHLYAKSKTEGYNAVIGGWSVYVPLYADLTCKRDGSISWSNWGQIPTSPVYQHIENRIVGNDYSLLADFITLPLAANNVKPCIEIAVESNTGGYAIRTVEIPIPTSGWKPGVIYRYNIEIDSNYNIVLNTPTVSPWIDAMGGVIVIDPTQKAMPQND